MRRKITLRLQPQKYKEYWKQHRQKTYEKLRQKINPYLDENFRYGAIKDKSNWLVDKQISYMRKVLSGVERYGNYDIYRASLFKKNYLEVYNETSFRIGTSDIIRETRNRIRHMDAETFKEFYDFVDDMGFKSVVFGFATLYRGTGEKVEAMMKEINGIIDTFSKLYGKDI